MFSDLFGRDNEPPSCTDTEYSDTSESDQESDGNGSESEIEMVDVTPRAVPIQMGHAVPSNGSGPGYHDHNEDDGEVEWTDDEEYELDEEDEDRFFNQPEVNARADRIPEQLTDRATAFIEDYTDYLSHDDTVDPPNTDCPICLESMEEHVCVQIKHVGDCKHVFGLECLHDFLKHDPDVKKACPLCRQEWIPDVYSWEDDFEDENEDEDHEPAPLSRLGRRLLRRQLRNHPIEPAHAPAAAASAPRPNPFGDTLRGYFYELGGYDRLNEPDGDRWEQEVNSRGDPRSPSYMTQEPRFARRAAYEASGGNWDPIATLQYVIDTSYDDEEGEESLDDHRADRGGRGGGSGRLRHSN
ncbi:Nn.00g083060.m01.CDS01 [Neocucurbitaria sp. VM-36]